MRRRKSETDSTTSKNPLSPLVHEVFNALNLKSGDLRLTGEAQLVQEHSGVDANTINSGKLILDQQGTVSPFQYDYWSSPVNNSGIFSFLGGKFDGVDSSVNPFKPTQILNYSNF